MKNRKTALLLIALLLTLCLSVASAAELSRVYGKTTDKIRVRSGASTSASITDNIIRNACVYITSSKTSGSTTFVQIKYRAKDGSIQTGWSAQKVGRSTYIDVLSAKEAKKTFSVSGGDLPSKKVGTFTIGKKTASSSSEKSSASTSVSAVKDIQTKLKALGFYSGSVTGNVGSRTKAAIKAFQKKYGLTADGVAGAKTVAKIDSVYKSKNKSSSSSSASSASPSSAPSVKVSGKVYNLNWFKAKNNGIFKEIGLYKGYNATLKDLYTGRSLSIRIQSAGNHLDVEPRTAGDTKTLCAIYGVSSADNITSRTCYQRRPMLLTSQTGYKFVCSIYGVPHGDEVITDNNYDGQFCLHFLNSKTHGSNRVDSDHMAAIQTAIDMIGSSKVKKLEDL